MNPQSLGTLLLAVTLVGYASVQAQNGSHAPPETPSPPARDAVSSSSPSDPGQGTQPPSSQNRSCVNSSWVYGADTRKVTSRLGEGIVYLSGRSHGDFYEIELTSIPDVWIEEANGAALVTMSASGVFLRSVGTGTRRSVRDEGFDEFSIPFDTREMAECYAAELRGELARVRQAQGPGGAPAEPARAPAAAGGAGGDGWGRWEAIPDTRQNCIQYQVRPTEAGAAGGGVYEYRFRNVCDAVVTLRCNIVDLDRVIRRDLTVELGPNETAAGAAGRIAASGPPAFERLESATRENPVYRPSPARATP